MDQPVPNVTESDVTRVIERDFRDADRARVKSLLEEYTEADGPVPVPRAHLAILKLSEGNLEKVAEHVEDARVDYRDVLAWAEYSRYLAASEFPTAADEKRTIDEDWAEYKSWLDRK